MAIGDSSNDMEMLEWAGCSVAMENSAPKVRQAAKYVTDTNNNDGSGKGSSAFSENRKDRRNGMTKKSDYDASSIAVLEGLEAVEKEAGHVYRQRLQKRVKPFDL